MLMILIGIYRYLMRRKYIRATFFYSILKCQASHSSMLFRRSFSIQRYKDALCQAKTKRARHSPLT